MILALVFIVFTALFVNIFIKLSYIIGIFTHFSISICISFLRIVFRIFYYFMFGCLFLLVFALLLCAIQANIDKDVNCLQSNNNASSKNLWLLFSASFLFLKIWFSKSDNITLRHFVFLIVYLLLFYLSILKLRILRKL